MPSGYLSDDVYGQVTSSVPIVCVDIIPVRQDEDGSWSVGIIQRATGSQTGRLTILGGRIYHSESIDEAITRHLSTDLQINFFSYLDGISTEKPFIVQQYFQSPSSDSDTYGFDPTKHAIALTYLVKIADTPNPVNEASAFKWIYDIAEGEFGFNQQLVTRKALDHLSAR